MNGKAILAWLKKHWLIVVLGVVALAALPTAWFFAQSMNTTVVDEFGKKVTTEFNSVAGPTAKVNYGVPSVSGGKTLERSDYLNQAMIDRYAEIWAIVQGKTGEVSEKGLKFNQNDHRLLIDGLFPKPAEEGQAFLTLKAREFTRAFIDFHPRILAEARAGMPPTVESVVQQLSDYQQSVLDRIKAESGREPDAKEMETLSKELQDMRIARYRARANELGVYADVSVFDGVPTAVPDVAPSLARCWDWQERAWMHHDIVRAVARANGSAGIPEGIVKRLIKISADKTAWDAGDRGTPAPQAFDPGEDKAPTDFSRSVTGRVSGPGSKNKWFDVRTITLEIVVSSQRLPAFIDALAATNFITVLDLDLNKADVHADLREGFFYGDEHVVKATMKLEFVMLRAWRAADMPDDVKVGLGMVDGVEGAAAPAAAPAPPAARPRPPAGGAPAGRPAGRPPRDG